MLNRIVTDNLAKQISSSWLIGDNSSFDTAYKQMAAQGQSFFQASGDDGAFYPGIAESADDTNITLVGGTTLYTTGPGGALTSESAWNWRITDPPYTNATGGGISLNNLAIPSWQTGISMAGNQGSTTLRNIPDVALTADGIYVIADNGTGYSVGGTSAAAPLWAGYTALINQQAAFFGSPTVGFLNPAIYAIGKGTNYTLNFHDITAGNNTNAAVLNKYLAVAGYDLCTGWGTPNGTNLINTLVPPVYFTAITNAGWSLLAESASPPTGAINPGDTVTVSFTLKNQGTLATGNLVATLQPNAGVLVPGGPQTYGAVAAFGGSASQPFTFTAAGTCGSNIVAALQLQDGTNNLGTVNFTLPLGGFSYNRGQSFAQNFDGVTAPALPSGWTTVNLSGTVNNWVTTTAFDDTPPNSVFISDIASTSENALVSPVIFIVSTNAQLGFRHNYSFEYRSTSGHPYRDGGVLEIKIGNGAFTDILAAGGSFVAGGYINSISTTSNPLGVRSAWVNSSGGWQTVTGQPPGRRRRTIRPVALELRDRQRQFRHRRGRLVCGFHFHHRPGHHDQLFAGVHRSGRQPVAGKQFTECRTEFNLHANRHKSRPAVRRECDGDRHRAGKHDVCLRVRPVTTIRRARSSGRRECCRLTRPQISRLRFHRLEEIFSPTSSASTRSRRKPPPPTTPPRLFPRRSLPCLRASVSGRPARPSNAAAMRRLPSPSPAPRRWHSMELGRIPVAGATNASFLLTNLHLPNHTVAVTVTNLSGGATSNAVVTVIDTLPPVITLNGGNPIFVELGGTFTDPGAQPMTFARASFL